MRREATAAILFKQKVEIGALPSVSRHDTALLDANVHYSVARDDNLSERKGRQIGSPEGKKIPTIYSPELAAENKSLGESKGGCPLGRRAFVSLPPKKGRQGARSKIMLPLEGGMRSGSPSKVDID